MHQVFLLLHLLSFLCGLSFPRARDPQTCACSLRQVCRQTLQAAMCPSHSSLRCVLDHSSLMYVLHHISLRCVLHHSSFSGVLHHSLLLLLTPCAEFKCLPRSSCHSSIRHTHLALSRVISHAKDPCQQVMVGMLLPAWARSLCFQTFVAISIVLPMTDT